MFKRHRKSCNSFILYIRQVCQLEKINSSILPFFTKLPFRRHFLASRYRGNDKDCSKIWKFFDRFSLYTAVKLQLLTWFCTIFVFAVDKKCPTSGPLHPTNLRKWPAIKCVLYKWYKMNYSRYYVTLQRWCKVFFNHFYSVEHFPVSGLNIRAWLHMHSH